MKITSTWLLTFLVIFQFGCKDSATRSQDHIAWSAKVAETSLNLMAGAEPARSLRYIDSAYTTLSNPGIKDLWVKYQVKTSYYTFYDNSPRKRRMYVDSMLTILKDVKAEYKHEYAISLFELAGLLQTEKKYNQAFQVYYQGRKFAKGNVDNCSLSEFSNALGIIRYRQQQYKEAIPFLKQALIEIQSCGGTEFKYGFIQHQSVLNSIALCFEKSSAQDSAIYYYNRALDFILSVGRKYPNKQDFVTTARAVVEGNLGGVYAQKGDFKTAEKHLLTNIKLNDREGFSIEDSQTAKIKLINLYIAFNEYTHAEYLLNQLERDLGSGRGKSSSHEKIKEQWYFLKAAFYEKTGNISSAYQFSKRYHAYRDSLDRNEKELKTVDLDQVFAQQQQKYELSLLEKQNQLKSNFMIALGVLLTMSVLFGLLIWTFYKRSDQHVTNLQMLNMQMQQALGALENSHRENTRLMKIVAHDLRNPIGAMYSAADIMLQDSLRSDEDSEFLTMIRDSGTNSLNLISNLLAMDTAGEVTLKLEHVELARLVKYCIDMLAVKARDKQQTIHADLPPVTLMLDYEKMWRVVSNLIYNAIKFTPIGRNIYVNVIEKSEHVVLTIKDEGIGIPSELGEKVFYPFTHSKRKGTSGEESFGLGLSITKQIIEVHNGEISFISMLNKGTEFTIRLPKTTT